MGEGEGVTVATEAGVTHQIEAVGHGIPGQRCPSDLAWENDYRPLEAPITQLQPGADNRLAKVLDEEEAEIAAWRTHKAGSRVSSISGASEMGLLRSAC